MVACVGQLNTSEARDAATAEERHPFRAFEQKAAAFFTHQRLRVYANLTRWVSLTSYALTAIAGIAMWGAFVNVGRINLGGDFPAFYWAGKAVLQGRLHELYDPTVQEQFLETLISPVPPTGELRAFVSPPYWALAFVPFACLPFPLAVVTFLGFSAALFITSAHLLRGELPTLRELGGSLRVSWLACSFYPLLFSFLTCQTTGFLLLSWVSVFLLLRRGHDFRAGLVLGLLAAKPQIMLGPLVILLAARRKRALGGVLLTAGAWVALGFWFMPESMQAYPRVAHQISEYFRSDEYPRWGQMSLFGFGTLLLDPISRRLGTALGMLLVCVSLGALLLLVRAVPWAPRTRAWDLNMAACLALGMIATPHLYTYDLALLLLPFAIVVHHVGKLDAPFLLDGGPLLAASGCLGLSALLCSHLSLAVQQAEKALGLPLVTLQLTPLVVLWFVARVHESARAARSTTQLPTS